jgi:large subunit ribosomal protein L28
MHPAFNGESGLTSHFTAWRKPVDYCKINTSATDVFGNRPGRNSRVMARVCDVCGKGPQFGNTISHAHNVSKRRWNVNLRPVHAKVGASTKHIRACTACIRSGKVTKA